jgi:Dyp-type peroxidase family
VKTTASEPNSSRPSAPEEPVLQVRNIQGNILNGFNKPFEIFAFLKIDDPLNFRLWLRDNVGNITTAADTISFNRLYRALRQRRGHGRHLCALWWNIAFSFSGLKSLAPKSAEEFCDKAFRAGLHQRSAMLGDPTSGDGASQTWVVGGPNNEADVLVILAADDKSHIEAELTLFELELRGASIIYKEFGAQISGPMGAQEHFGFHDGISQPGIRGRVSDSPTDVLTLRQNPHNPNHGKPGQDLVNPGEFVFGYLSQATPEEIQPSPPIPSWVKDGSFLVMRRLRQNVPEFLRFVSSQSKALEINKELLEAMLVGRFKSGAPLMRTQIDDPQMAKDDCQNNYFYFASNSLSLPNPTNAAVMAEVCIPGLLPPPDPDGQTCPFSSHIRKANPRDDPKRFGTQLGLPATLTHRLLRRGIPYGPPYSGTDPFPDDGIDRGLLFLSYQTSIENQFEFIQIRWANDPEGNEGIGQDPLIGQAGEHGQRFFALPLKGKYTDIVSFRPLPWVLPTGGGYFFSPSLTCLSDLAENRLP